MSNLTINISRYNSSSRYKIVTGLPALDNLNKPLTFLDKVIFSYNKGRYEYGYYLGLTESGKSARILSAFPINDNGSVSLSKFYVTSMNSPINLVKTDWDSSLETPQQTEVINQLRSGQLTVTIH